MSRGPPHLTRHGVLVYVSNMDALKSSGPPLIMHMAYHGFNLFFILLVMFIYYGSRLETEVSEAFFKGALAEYFPEGVRPVVLPGLVYDRVVQQLAWVYEVTGANTAKENETLFREGVWVCVLLACIWVYALTLMRLVYSGKPEQPAMPVGKVLGHGFVVISVVGVIEYLVFRFVIMQYKAVSDEEIQERVLRRVREVLG